ncbi:MAG: class II aldolase/adducin family protein [Anaerolinea sp.]|nr:class II aldolase/adducin family protein [Anaerolinea sp.]
MLSNPNRPGDGSEQALRVALCAVGRLMYHNGLIDAASGNLSARLADGSILTTPTGFAKGFLEPEDLIVVDQSGQRLTVPSGTEHLQPTSELLMHLECYRQRPDIGGVVHAHPPTAIALTVAGYDWNRAIIPEAFVTLGLIPVTAYANPASAENQAAIRDLIGQHDVILLSHHGSLTVADTVWNAYLRLETLEHTARILYMAEQLGGARDLAPDAVRKLIEHRRRLGFARPGDDVRFDRLLKRDEHPPPKPDSP